MTNQETLKLALDALQVSVSCTDMYYVPLGKSMIPEVEEAIKAREEALAKQEQDEPVAQCCSAGIAHDCHAGDGCRIVERIKSALQPKQEQDEPVVNNKFTRAWISLAELPGGMMQGPQGLFGPIPASTSCWITTSESERDRCLHKGDAMLQIYTKPQPSQKPLTEINIELLETLKWIAKYIDAAPDALTEAKRWLAIAQFVITKAEAAHNTKD